MRRVGGLLPVAVLVTVLAAGCGSGSEPADAGPSRAGPLLAPADGVPAAVVALVPGGGWRSADPSGLVPLAQALADGGYAAGTLTYRTAQDGAVFPVPVADVLCASAELAADAADEAGRPVPLVLLGHSAGGQLALLAALRPSLREDCPAPPVDPVAVVGLAGAYGVREIPELAQPLFGTVPEEDADRWRDGDPLAWADERPELPVLLLHGSADDVVPPEGSRRAAAVLRAGGHRVEQRDLPGADHASVYRPEVAAEPVLAWLAEVAPAA